MAVAIPWVIAAVAAAGAVSQANAKTAAADQNAGIAARNAVISKQQGEADVKQQERVNYLRLSSIGAAVGASGITMEGSALDILESSSTQAQLDVQNIRYNAELKSMGFAESAEQNKRAAQTSSDQGMYSAVSAGLQGYAGAGGFSGTGTKVGDSQFPQGDRYR